MTRLRRVATGVAALAVAALALSGCLYAAIPAETTQPTGVATTNPPPDTDGVPDALLPYYGQSLDWTACGDQLDCTTVTAPLDWSDPSKGSDIQLAVVRHHADSGHPIGSLLMDPGGPGASGFTYVQDSYMYAFGQPLIDDYDLIGFDPRGVGRSTALTCLDSAGLDRFLYSQPDAPRGSADWTAGVRATAQTFADGCEQHSGDLLPYLTTEMAARDMDLIRAVLGEKKLDYLGYSYGTKLGATYAGLFPDKVDRMVLDGALDPSLDGVEIDAQQAAGFQSALAAYLKSCLAGDDCPFTGTVDQALADLATLLASTDASPQTTSDGRQLNGTSFFTGISYALYSQDSWPYLTQAISDVAQGNPDLAMQLADGYNDRADGPDGSYSSNEISVYWAYTCVDYPSDDVAADDAADKAQVAQNAPTIAPYWQYQYDVCGGWPVKGTADNAAITADGAPPIVVVGTTNDPATPYKWAQALAGELSSGVLVTRVGEGHTGYLKGNQCIDSAVEDYLLHGTVPAEGLTCQ